MTSPTFTGIPRELRHRIYDFLYTGYIIPSTRRKNQLALWLVNRQISEEASYCFSNKVIFYDEPQNLEGYFSAMGQNSRNLVKNVELEFYWRHGLDHEEMPIFSELRDLPNLQNVTISNFGQKEMDFEEELERLIDRGIQQLVGRANIFFEQCWGNWLTIRVWKCAKGQTEWEVDTSGERFILDTQGRTRWDEEMSVYRWTPKSDRLSS